jgi:hypothetical protein
MQQAKRSIVTAGWLTGQYILWVRGKAVILKSSDVKNPYI